MQTMPSFWKSVHYRANAPFMARASRKDQTQPPEKRSKRGGWRSFPVHLRAARASGAVRPEHRCRCSRTELVYNRWGGRMARLAYLFAAVVLKHMQLGLFLVVGPIMRSRFGWRWGTVVQALRASSGTAANVKVWRLGRHVGYADLANSDAVSQPLRQSHELAWGCGRGNGSDDDVSRIP